ncbi:MAG: CHC2 zinc finger domain-containing protein [Burkholderiaceae bacterium]
MRRPVRTSAVFARFTPRRPRRSRSAPSKQFYHCFGCGAHGSAIGFLMEHGGLGYVDAITELAQSLGLEVPQERGGSHCGPARSACWRRWPMPRSSTSAGGRVAACHRLSEAQGLGGETAAAYRLGYAPEGWRALEAAVPDYQAEVLVTAGLVIVGDEDSADGGGRRKRYDRFRDRIMFPIRNARPGHRFRRPGARARRAEYLNSPETSPSPRGASSTACTKRARPCGPRTASWSSRATWTS